MDMWRLAYVCPKARRRRIQAVRCGKLRVGAGDRRRGPVLSRNHRAVPTGFLGAIEGFVGYSQQLLEIRTHSRVGDAEACRKGGGSARKQVLGELCANPIDHFLSLRGAGVRQNQNELLTTPACGQVAVAQTRAQSLGKEPERLITRLVSA